MPDSAVIKTNKPFFLPHFATTFTGRPALALHIDRLGKHIAPRFAHRYCLAIAPAIKVTASSIDTVQQCEQHSALVHGFDGALLLGDFAPVDDTTGINNIIVTMEINGEKSSGSLDKMGINYQELLAQLSTYFTFKMGDILLVELSNSEMELKIGDTLTATCGETSQLIIRVK